MTQEKTSDGGTPGPDSSRFRALVENSQTVVNLFALDGTLLYTNPAITTVLGWAPEDLIGRSGPDLLHPDDMPDALATFESSLARPGVAIPFRHRMRHKDGSWRMVEGTGTNRLPDPDVGALVSSFQDITERVRIEQALREGEERYRTLFENAPVGIGVARADGVLLAFNDAMLKPGGYTREQIRPSATSPLSTRTRPSATPCWPNSAAPAGCGTGKCAFARSRAGPTTPCSA
jgi:PAS domain S-box-containing protein